MQFYSRLIVFCYCFAICNILLRSNLWAGCAARYCHLLDRAMFLTLKVLVLYYTRNENVAMYVDSSFYSIQLGSLFMETE